MFICLSMEGLSPFVTFAFVAIVLSTAVGFYLALRSRTFLLLMGTWVAIQTAMGLSGAFQNTSVLPPRIMLLGMLPALILLGAFAFSGWGMRCTQEIDLRWLTLCHSVRVFVELVLAVLYQHGAMSVLVTYHGFNFDILSGMTAPVMAILLFKDGKLKWPRGLLIWNVVCLLLLLVVIATAILSTPSPLQRWSFDQPNIAILHWPFCLLPAFVAPMMVGGHVLAIRKLWHGEIINAGR